MLAEMGLDERTLRVIEDGLEEAHEYAIDTKMGGVFPEEEAGVQARIDDLGAALAVVRGLLRVFESPGEIDEYD